MIGQYFATPQEWRDNVRNVIEQTYNYIRDMFSNNWGSWAMYKYFAAHEKPTAMDRPIQIFGSYNNATGPVWSNQRVLLKTKLANPNDPVIAWYFDVSNGTNRTKTFSETAKNSPLYNLLFASRHTIGDY
ncbi:hypothetical protein ACJA23_02910 [Mycoplasma corogypsi]|uniref:hypothetical protein n=1 Tax=Mycoplasma corogypsi TaxID=2106 RepID=UPI00387387AF